MPKRSENEIAADSFTREIHSPDNLASRETLGSFEFLAKWEVNTLLISRKHV